MKMKKMQILVVVFLTAFVAFQGMALAEAIQGKVAGIDATAKSLSLSRNNPATGVAEKLAISVNPETAFSGVASLEELKAGDDISVDVQKGEAAGSWKATSVKVNKM